MTITIAPSPGYDDGNGAELNTTPDRVTAFTEEAVREALYAAVEEKGEDYTYPNAVDGLDCTYLEYDDNDQPIGPSCIVGNVLLRLGVDPLVLKSAEGHFASKAVSGLGISDDVAKALEYAQVAQDWGDTWGQARSAFEARLAGKDTK